MKLLAGWAVSAGLVLVASAANAQVLAPAGYGRPAYSTASDFEAPYEEVPPVPQPYVRPRPYAYDPAADAPYASDPALLPPLEVYAVLRDNGFLPLGIPHQRGFVYEISAIDPDGEHGRLLIDAHSGRIVRFLPAFGERRNYDERGPYRAQAAVPAPSWVVRPLPRPPAPIPHVASRAMPLPSTKPAIPAKPSEPAQRSAAAQPQAPATATVGETKPAPPLIRPTQPMPQVQGLQ